MSWRRHAGLFVGLAVASAALGGADALLFTLGAMPLASLPAGLAVAAFLVFGNRALPGLVAGALWQAAGVGDPAAALTALAAPAEGWIASRLFALLTRARQDSAGNLFEDPASAAARLALASALAACLAPALVAVQRALIGATGAEIASEAAVGWCAQFLGVCLAGPLLLHIADRARRGPGLRTWLVPAGLVVSATAPLAYLLHAFAESGGFSASTNDWVQDSVSAALFATLLTTGLLLVALGSYVAAVRHRSRLQLLVAEHAADYIVLREVEGGRSRIVLASQSYRRLLAGVAGIAPRIHEEDRERARALFYEVSRSGESARYEYRVVDGAGRVAWLETEASVVRKRGLPGRLVLTVSRDVTARREAAARLAEQEERFRSLTKLSSDWCWEQDAELRVTLITNDWTGGGAADAAFSERLRLALGRRLWELNGVDPVEGSWDALRKVLEARQPFRAFEYVVRRADGTTQFVSTSGEPVFAPDGRFTGYRGVSTDITARMRSEAELAASEQRYRDLQEHVPVGIVVMQEGRIQFSNPEARRLLNVLPGMATGELLEQLIEPAQREAFQRRYAECMRTGTAARDLEIKIAAPAGERWLDAALQRIDWERRPGMITFFRDTTAEKLNRRELEDSDRRLRQIVDMVPYVLYAKDRSGRYLLSNPAHAAFHGKIPEELLGSAGATVAVTDSDRAAMDEGDRQVWDTLRRHDQLGVVRTDAQGRPRYFNLIKIPFAFQGETMDSILGIAIDVSDMRERSRDLEDALKKLSAKEAESRLVLDNINELILIFRPRNGRLEVVYRSPSFERQFPGEVQHGPEAGPRVHPEDQLRVRREWAELLRHGSQTRTEYRLQLADGSEHWLDVQTVVIRDATGAAESAISVGRDITERKRSESRVQEMQRMEAIGQLTGGLAHDFNNLLGVVVGNLDLLGESLPGDATVQLRYRTALDAALRGAEVTRALLAVARRQPLEVSVQDLNALIAEMLPLLHSSVGSAVTLSFEPCEGALATPLDTAGLSTAVLNLALNARDAMKDNTTERRLVLRTRREPGAAVLEVIDNGCGISEEVRAHVFEPFFTTKERGKGTGLGLAMVQGYAAQLEGSATLQSAPGRGTTVALRLPLAPEVAPAAAPQAAAEPAARSGVPRLRILVADDEPELCELACTWLSALGHAATGVHSSAQALERLPEGFDLLFTDVLMPGPMDGLALAREALLRQPALQVLIASGYAQSLVDNTTTLPGPLLNKPYRRHDLEREIGKLFEGTARQTGA